MHQQQQQQQQQQLCNLKIHVNGQSTFFLSQKIISTYSGKLKRVINQEQEEKKKKKKKKTQIRNPSIEINEFPGGSYGFELISRFCYNNGRIPITPSNISLLHCSAIFLEMTEDFSPCNLLHQTETFLEGMFYWSWSDILISLKNCEGFFTSAESSGLLSKLISSLLTKISQNSDLCLNPIPSPSPSSSSSSPETPVTGFRLFSSSSTKTTPESTSITATPSSPSKSWWFDDLTILPPKIIEKVIQTMGYYGPDNNNLVITKFLLHYLKTAFQTKSGNGYSGLAETAVYGVVLMGKTAFSCRGLFWVLRVVSGFGMKRECRDGLERLIGEMLEKATLDDLLVCGGTNHNTSSGEVYDVDLVLRLIRVFVNGSDGGGVTVQRMKKVGRLVDKYMGEISPDHNLKVSKFLAVAESLPACARDCFDGVYRAIDIYLESHPTLSFEKRSKLCKCLNYEKLTLEACKDLAKNPRIPPNVAVQALISQKSKVPPKKVTKVVAPETPIPSDTSLTNLYTSSDTEKNSECSEDKEELKLNLQRMQCRVMELEKVCSEMKNQMSKMVKAKVMGTPVHNRTLYKLC